MKGLSNYVPIPRIHGKTNRLPKHALSFASIEHVVRFFLNYADQHASKHGIWKTYFDSAESTENIHAAAYSTFCKLWHSLLPSIILMKPMTDLCFVCQQNSEAIVKATNQPDAEKSATIEAAQNHLHVVQLERSYYKSTNDFCKRSIRDHFTVSDIFSPPTPHSNIPANSKNIAAHYSLDYVQQVHYPSDPLQPGPIFFLTPRKCNIFGVHCEAIPRQINFLTDESVDCGKGANTVVSQLHYFFNHHALGEKELYLHCDNCVGQNKNSCMLQYLTWRCLTNRHEKITLSFLVVGHTKFAPDLCFGLVKRKFRRTKVGSLKDIVQTVNDSAVCNVAQLVGNEDGSTIVPVYDWTSFFAPKMKKVPSIKKYSHFQMDKTTPGIINLKLRSDSETEQCQILKEPWQADPDVLPDIVAPKGLSAERQWYLYHQIRPFCSENSDKDTTCPLPEIPQPGSRGATHSPPPLQASASVQEIESIPETLPPSKRQRLCGTCKKPGHNSRSCPANNGT